MPGEIEKKNLNSMCVCLSSPPPPKKLSNRKNAPIWILRDYHVTRGHIETTTFFLTTEIQFLAGYKRMTHNRNVDVIENVSHWKGNMAVINTGQNCGSKLI